MERESFVFYKSFFDAIDACPEENQRNIYRAIVAYALMGEEPELRGIEYAMFMMAKPQIDANNRRFTNGKKGGAKTGNQNARKNKSNDQKQPSVEFEKQPKQPSVVFCEQPKQPNVNVNENENVNVNVNDIVDDDIEKKWFNEYFDSTAFLLREQFIKSLHSENPETCSDEDLKNIANEAMMDFARQKKIHVDYQDFVRHLESVVRLKNREYKKSKNSSNGFEAYIEQQKRLINEQGISI